MTGGADAKLRKVLYHYGEGHQLGKLREEAKELDEAAEAYGRVGDERSREALLGEMADVRVMIRQIELSLDAEGEVSALMAYKVERQLSRIRRDAENA